MPKAIMNEISKPTSAISTAGLVLSTAALLSFLARTFIDYGFVYEELNLGALSLGLVTLFNLALFGGWIWALLSASHGGRRAIAVLLGYHVLLVLFGVSTLLSFCPSPCRTAWPVAEIATWSNLVIGIPATLLAARQVWGYRQKS